MILLNTHNNSLTELNSKINLNLIEIFAFTTLTTIILVTIKHFSYYFSLLIVKREKKLKSKTEKKIPMSVDDKIIKIQKKIKLRLAEKKLLLLEQELSFIEPLTQEEKNNKEIKELDYLKKERKK